MPLTDKDLELAREHARDAEKINADLKEGGDELRKDPEKRKEWEEEWGHMQDKMNS